MSNRSNHSRMIWLAAIVCMLASFAIAQSTQPTEASVFDSKAIKPPSHAVTTSTDPKPTNALDWQRLVIAMGIVLGLILLLKFLVAKMYPGLAKQSKAKVVKVLSRSAIAPKQQVILLQIGRRIVVVGDSAGQMGTLSEITDPDEIASLVGQLESNELVNTPKNRFSGFFGRATQAFDEPMIPEQQQIDRTEEPTPEITAAQTEISGLIDRMRSLTKVVRREDTV